MTKVEPISEARQQQVISESSHYLELAGKLYATQFPQIPILFDLYGRAAGMYKVTSRGACIRFNPWLFAKYWRENFSVTIPHEVAHYVVHKQFGRQPPHGEKWKAVMRLFNADDSRTCQFDMTGIPQRQMSRVQYQCGCRDHQLSARIHNCIQRGQVYLCKACSGKLTLAKVV